MATDLKWLQGRISENPSVEDIDRKQLLVDFLKALVDEQGAKRAVPIEEASSK